METFNDSKTYAIFSTPANRRIINNLEKKGAKVFQFPLVETAIINDPTIFSFIENDLYQFDWLIFPDIFAVDYYLRILEMTDFDLFELDEKRILAMGESVSDRLRFSQIHSDLIPASINADEIFSAISNYLKGNKLNEINFLFLKYRGFENELTYKLQEFKAKVKELEIYEISGKNENARLKALIKGGAIDEFIINSPEDLFSLKIYFTPVKLSELLSDITFSATNDSSMQTLLENNLNPKYFS
ncbi:hypothetical protein BH10ACI1_BH10ACI1_35870 [soil metagenome]